MIRGNSLGFVAYLVAGLYLVNSAFAFITLPEAILGIQKWIFAVIAVMLLFAGIKLLARKRMPPIR